MMMTMMMMVTKLKTCFMVARHWSWLEVMVADGRRPANIIIQDFVNRAISLEGEEGWMEGGQVDWSQLDTS